jgi:transcriptional regulator with XRE-family HTH domain
MISYTEIIRGLREDKDLKQAEVAKIIGTSQQHYSKYENGEYEIPVRSLMILADYYDVSTDYMLGRTNCREGVAGQNKKVDIDTTAGAVISDILSLSKKGRAAVVEYIELQKIKESKNS